MYKELDRYYKGKERRTVEASEMNFDAYGFPVGDIIVDLYKHLNKRWWQKNIYHNHLTEIYKKALNNLNIEYYI